MQETQETQVGSLGQEDVLQQGKATLSSILDWKIPWMEEPDYSPWGHKESDTEGWYGEGGGRGLQEHVYTRGRFMLMYGKTNTIL